MQRMKKSAKQKKPLKRANAYGLMQLLPSVGKSLASKHGIKHFSTNQLPDPSINIELGTINLKQAIDRYGGQVEYALAAYDAGDTPVRQWPPATTTRTSRSSSSPSPTPRPANTSRPSCATARSTAPSTQPDSGCPRCLAFGHQGEPGAPPFASFQRMVGLPPNSVIPTAGGVLCRRNRGPRRANLLVGWSVEGPPAFRFCLFLPLSVLAVVCSPPGAPSIAPLSHAMGGSNTARTTTFVFAWKRPTARSIAAWGAAPGSGPPQACGLKAHAIAAASRTRLKIFPRFPQQIRVSSPSTPQNPPRPHQPNHIIHLKSWHSSYAPLATINIWIKSIEGQLPSRGNRPPPPAAPFFLN